MNTHSLLVKECPLLLPLNKEKTVYDGFITVQGRDFRIRIRLPSDHHLKRAKLHCCWQLKQLLRGYGNIVKQLGLTPLVMTMVVGYYVPPSNFNESKRKKRLHHSADLVSFILELKTVMEVALKSRLEYRSIPPPQYYSQLISEMEALGWDKLLFINTEFRTLKLRAEDLSGRQHHIKVELKPKHPADAPECSADLPIPLAITWTPQSSLGHVHAQFLLVLESLAQFWEVLEEIDQKTWVLEPEKPTRADTTRRIAIGNNVSIKVEVDARHPKMLPECCLLGADHMVTPLRNKLNANMHLWNSDCSVLQNLQDVLEIEFPSPTTHEKSSFSVECGICYSYRLESAIPDQMCNDPRCGQPFHQACLYEWLRGLPSSRQSFNIVFGECPYCNKPITVKMATQKP